jgi:hypothetical protein
LVRNSPPTSRTGKQFKKKRKKILKTENQNDAKVLLLLFYD